MSAVVLPTAAQDSLVVAADPNKTSSDSVIVFGDLNIAFAESLAARRATLPNNFWGHAQAADLRLFHRVYFIDEPTFERLMRAADATSYPAFYFSVPAAVVGALASGEGGDAAYRLALSEGLAFGASVQIKKIAERIRPVRHIDFLPVKGRSDRTTTRQAKSYGFPSGHAAVASALVTSWSLSYPRWYVIAPGTVWVAGIGLSRIWRGRHYPGDVAVGIVLGIVSAMLVHEIAPHITPNLLKDESSGPVFSVRVPLP